MILFFRLRHFVRTQQKLVRALALAFLFLITAGIVAHNMYEEHKASTKVFRGVMLSNVESPNLDTIINAFLEKIKLEGYSERVEITHLNAKGSSATFADYIREATRSRYDFIVTTTTTATQAIVRTHTKTPLFYMAISNPDAAHVFTRSQALTTGTSVPFPIEEFFEYIHKITPNAGTTIADREGTFALVYSGEEENAIDTIKQVEEYLVKNGYNYREMIVSNAQEIEELGTDFIENNTIDALLIANDITIQMNMSAMRSLAESKKIPIYCVSNPSKGSGCLASMTFSLAITGEKTADLLIEFIKGKELIDIPAVKLDAWENLYLNEKILSDLNIALPEDIGIFIPLE